MLSIAHHDSERTILPKHWRLYERPLNGGFGQFYQLQRENSTIATWLKQAGYRTALFGKYLNGYPDPSNRTYIPPGWDEWVSPAKGRPYTELITH